MAATAHVKPAARPSWRMTSASMPRAECVSSTSRSGMAPSIYCLQTEPLGRVEAGAHVRPVDDVPQRAEEVGLHVLVLQVEGVLPGIEDEQGHRAIAHAALVVVDLLDDQA